MTSLIQDVRFKLYPRGAIASEKQGDSRCVCVRMYVCVCECVRVRVYVCLHECSVQQMIHKYIFLALVSSRSIMCTYSILFTLTVGVCHVLPLSLFLLQQSTGGIVNNIMVS